MTPEQAERLDALYGLWYQFDSLSFRLDGTEDQLRLVLLGLVLACLVLSVWTGYLYRRIRRLEGSGRRPSAPCGPSTRSA